MTKNKKINDQASEEDSAERQPRAAKHAPSPDDVKDRLAARRSGPSRPLSRLAGVETALNTRSAALAKLSSVPQKQPDKDLLLHQLCRSVDTCGVPKTVEPKLKGDVIHLYSALGSKNATESILDRLTVAAANSAMNCYARAMATANPKAVDIHLRHATKSTQVVINLVDAKARLRDPNRLTVRNVKVEAGGQAIVGNVEAPKKRSSEEKRRSRSSPAKDEDADD